MKLLAWEALIAAVLMALLSVELSLCVCARPGCFPASCRAVGCSSVFSFILLRWIPINYAGGRETKRGTEAVRFRLSIVPSAPGVLLLSQKGLGNGHGRPMRPQTFFPSWLRGAGWVQGLQIPHTPPLPCLG